MDRLDEVRLFVAVADLRSFAAAARRLGVSPAQASKAVARLEDRLQARLLNRTTRDVSLTGFDDIALSRLLRPRLTTVEVSQQDLGRRAWESLADDAGGADGLDGGSGEGGGGGGGRVVTVDTRLIARDSTAPPALTP